MIILFQFSVLALALFICHWFGFWREGIFLMGGFYASTRVVFKVWAHVDKRPMVCALLTIFIIYHLAGGVARLDVSLFAAVLYGVGVGWVSHEVRKYIDIARANAAFRKQKEEEAEMQARFKLERGCDPDQLKSTALARGLSDLQVDLLLRKYCYWHSEYLKEAHIYYELNHLKYGIKYPPAYTTVQSWFEKAEKMFNL